MTLANQPGPWVLDAACVGIDPELWFPEKGGDPTDARRICAGCPVRLDCLDYALTVERWDGETAHGVWGGLSGMERRALLGSKASTPCLGCGTPVVYRGSHEPRCGACRDAHRDAARVERARARARVTCVGCGNSVRGDLPCPHCLLVRTRTDPTRRTA